MPLKFPQFHWEMPSINPSFYIFQHSFIKIPSKMSSSPIIFMAILPVLLSQIAPINAILCRTGVDLLGGPVADCGRGSQCLNTTSALGQTVYSCDFGGICETILNLRDGCVRDGKRMVCCCSTLDGCNFGQGTFLTRFDQNSSSKSKKQNQPTELNNAATFLKSQSSALDFVKEMESGTDF